jgi:hypothetical protein
VKTPRDIIEMLPDSVHAEVIEGEVIASAVTPTGRHAKIILAVRRAFARHGETLSIPTDGGAVELATANL